MSKKYYIMALNEESGCPTGFYYSVLAKDFEGVHGDYGYNPWYAGPKRYGGALPPLPDQLIERVLISVKMGAQRFRQHRDHGRANRLVRLLRVLGLGFEQPWTRRQVMRAVTLGDQGANVIEGILRQIDRVGAHVGDQPDGPLTGVNAFV